MNVVELYATLFGGFIALYSLVRLIQICWLLILPWVVVSFARHIQYPLVVRRRFWMSVTRLEILVFLVYLAVNITVLCIFVQNKADLSARAAVLTVINITPLFIGGRFAALLGVPLPTYYLSHHWIARVASLEGILHAVLATRGSRGSQPNATTSSGYIVSHALRIFRASLLISHKAAAGILVILSTSIWVVRRFLRTTFAKIHVGLAAAIAGGACWHVLDMAPTGRIPVFVTIGIWAASILVWSLRLFYFGSRAEVKQVSINSLGVQISVNSTRRVRVFPGCYFYVFFPGLPFGYNILQSHILDVSWYQPNQLLVKAGVTDFVFLMSRGGRLHRALRLKKDDKLFLDGPYGQDPQLGQYEIVVLVAKGLGIAGVLSAALSLVERRQHDLKAKDQAHSDQNPRLFRDRTQRVAILWVVESADQEAWAASKLKEIQDLDEQENVS